MDMIENIDDISEKAQNMKLTKNDFLNCLRDLTKEKILTLKEAKVVFENRIRKLIRSQDYEIQCQEAFAVRAA
jgi:hypothetical protein